MQNNILRINGEILEYDIQTKTDAIENLLGVKHFVRINKVSSHLSSFPPTKVPAEHYLVLGDNRNNSADSRVIGFVPRGEIVGRARHVVLSLDYDNYYIPRSGRFFEKL